MDYGEVGLEMYGCKEELDIGMVLERMLAGTENELAQSSRDNWDKSLIELV